jgi:hypothetical protein
VAIHRLFHESAVPVSADRQAKPAMSQNGGAAFSAAVHAVPSLNVAAPVAPAEATAAEAIA